MSGGRAVFLDRDGVLNRNVFNPATGAYESPHRVEDFAMLPGVVEALQRLQAAGYGLVLVTNQPSYAKRKTTLGATAAIHRRLADTLEGAGIQFLAFYYCLHHPDGVVPEYSRRCECRKPSPYFLLQAKARFGLDLAHSWMVGDRETDIQCGRAAGVRTIRIAADHSVAQSCGRTAADLTTRDLAAAVALLCAADGCAAPAPEQAVIELVSR